MDPQVPHKGNADFDLSDKAIPSELVAELGVDIFVPWTPSHTFVGTNVNDRIHGTVDSETIDGGAGDDVIEGAGGHDVLAGGAGSDTYLFGRSSGADTINNNDTATGKVDRLAIAGDVTTDDLELLKIDDSLLIRIRHTNDSVLVNHFFSNAGLDEIALSNGSGTVWTPAALNALLPATHADSFVGTAADDTYSVDNPLDAITEAAGGGTDTVLASSSYQLPSNVENLTLTGSPNIDGIGNELANTITGNSGANVLDGGEGVDTLSRWRRR